MRMNVYRKGYGVTRCLARYFMRFVHDLFSTRRGRALPRYTVSISTLALLSALLMSQPANAAVVCGEQPCAAARRVTSVCLDLDDEKKRATPVTTGE
jgi:hypothetical protein